MHAVFTYGTLQVDEVMYAVTGKYFSSCMAILKGYRRFKIKQRSYPGLIKREDSKTEGTLYRGVDIESLILLDTFEDVCYERCLIEVDVNGNTEEAFVYVTKDKYKHTLSDQEWSLEEFKRKYLSNYLSVI